MKKTLLHRMVTVLACACGACIATTAHTEQVARKPFVSSLPTPEPRKPAGRPAPAAQRPLTQPQAAPASASPASADSTAKKRPTAADIGTAVFMEKVGDRLVDKGVETAFRYTDSKVDQLESSARRKWSAFIGWLKQKTDPNKK